MQAIAWSLALALLQEASPPEEVYLTIHDDGSALVREVRNLQLTSGDQHIRLHDVSPRIVPESVHVRSLSDPDNLQVREQQFVFEILDRRSALETLLGRDVRLIRQLEYGEEIVEGRLLLGPTAPGRGGRQPAPIVVQLDDGRFRMLDDGDPILDSFSASAWNRPRLEWKVRAPRTADHRFELLYRSLGLRASVQYSLRLLHAPGQADFRAVASIVNDTGVSWQPLRVHLGGDPRAVSAGPATHRISGSCVLPHGKTTQLTFARDPALSVARTIQWFAPPHPLAGGETQGGMALLETLSMRLPGGTALPAGELEVLAVDEDGVAHRAGSLPVPAIAAGGSLTAPIGIAADLKAHVTLSTDENGTTHSVEVRSDRLQPVAVEIVQPLSGPAALVASSQAPSSSSPGLALFELAVPSGGRASLQYTLSKD